MIPFAQIQLLQPWGLLAGLAIPLLVLAYLTKESSKKRTVSSVVVLRQLAKRSSKRSRFFPPLRFWLELLALLLALFALPLPLLIRQGATAALLLDNSLSMRAVVGGQSSLERAKEALVRRVESAGSEQRFYLFTSSPRLTAVGKAALTANETLAALRSIEASYSGDALESSAEELSRSGRYSSVDIFSDRRAEFRDNIETLVNGQKESFTEVEEHAVGTTSTNVYLANAFIRHVSLPEPHQELVAVVGLSGKGSGNLTVSFTDVSNSAQPRSLGDYTVSVNHDFGLASSRNGLNQREVVHQLSGDYPRGEYRVTVSTSKSSSSQGVAIGDSILEDNSAWIVSGEVTQQGVLVVSEQGGSLGLENLPGLQVRNISASDFNALSTAEIKAYTLLVFHRIAPSSLLETPSLFILPPAGNPVFPISGGVTDARVSFWREEHPLTAYLRVPLLPFNATEIFSTPEWAQSIIRVEQGSVLVAGESRGIRLAGVGFELFPYEGLKTPVTSVLTLNLLNWLTRVETADGGGFGGKGRTVTGAEVQLGTAGDTVAAIELLAPDRTKSVWQRPSGEGSEVAELPAKLLTTVPGIYTIEKTLRGGERISKREAVNAFHNRESQTAEIQSYAAARKVRHEDKDFESARPIWPLLLLAALVALFAELLLAWIRPNYKLPFFRKGVFSRGGTA